MEPRDLDERHMRRALELARRGQGRVEPNPMVGCVIAEHERVISEGWHRQYGGPHAEIEAIRSGGAAVAGATMFVTLEPCSHHGKTPPCTEAILAAGLRRVVIADHDPFPEVSGRGAGRLQQAGLRVEVGLLADQAAAINAPYLKLIRSGRPWVLAKWAMTLDGKIASRSRDSQWITCEASRARAHQLRGRVDAVLVGRGAAIADDPLLTARPPGPRTATRIVLDSLASLPSDSRLARSARETPVLIATGPAAQRQDRDRLAAAGCQVLVCEASTHGQRLSQLLDELGRRRFTNVLAEGGGRVLGSLFDANHIDEAHVFIAPKLLGGADATPPLAGRGIERIAQALRLDHPAVERLDDDLYISGRVAPPLVARRALHE